MFLIFLSIFFIHFWLHFSFLLVFTTWAFLPHYQIDFGNVIFNTTWCPTLWMYYNLLDWIFICWSHFHIFDFNRWAILLHLRKSLFLAMLGLHCCTGFSLVVVHGWGTWFIVAASFCCGTQGLGRTASLVLAPRLRIWMPNSRAQAQ